MANSDFKEASQRTKTEEYENSFQLPFYVFSTLQAGILPDEALHLFHDGKYRPKYIFVFYSSQPCKILKTEFEAYKSNFLPSRFKTTLDYHIQSAVNIWLNTQENHAAPYSGMNTYKGCVYCPFRPGCITKDSAQEEEFLSRFSRIPYDPLSFR